MQEHCHAKLLATLYSLFAAVLPFAVTIRYSLFATRHSLPFRLGRSLALPFFPPLVPLKVGAHVLRHQLRTKVRSMEFYGLLTPCIHATGFSQWLMTEFDECRIHSAKKILFTTRHSPIANRHSLPFLRCKN
jgi:hypothetical protein